MIYAGMTFIATLVWSMTCFAAYLLLSCDGGVVLRWMVGLVVIGSYRPICSIIQMTGEQWKSFLLALAGAAFAALAFFICIYLVVE